MHRWREIMLTDKNVVVFGGTGSLGKLLVKRLLARECGKPKKLLIVSRDEAKQHFMRLEFLTAGGGDQTSFSITTISGFCNFILAISETTAQSGLP